MAAHEETRTDTGRFSPTAIAVGIFCCALLLRLIYLFSLHHDKVLLHIQPLDSAFYLQRAQEIRGGDFLGKGVFFQSGLLYSYGMALLGANRDAVMLVQLVAGSLAAAFASYLGTVMRDRTTGIIAGVMYAACSVLIFDAGNILSDTWVVFFVMLAVVSVYAAAGSGKYRWWFLCGVSLTIAGTAKPFVLIFLPLTILLWVLPVHAPSRHRLALISLSALAGIVLVLAPISLRNWTVSRELSPFPVTGGFNFYVGNNSQATGLLHIPTYLGVRNRIDQYAESTRTYPSMVLGRPVTFAEAGSFWLNKGLAYWRSDPAGALRLTVKKAALLLNNAEYDDNYSFDLFRDRILLLKLLPSAGFLIAPALFGLFCAIRRWSTAGPVAIMVSIYLLVLPLLFIIGRYRYPMLALGTLLGALALREIAAGIRAGNTRLAAIGIGSILVGAIVAFFPVVPEQELLNKRQVVQAQLVDAFIELGDPASALKVADAALRRKQTGMLLYETGRALHALKRDSEALPAVVRAVQIEPNLEEAHSFLEELSSKKNDPEEARLLGNATNNPGSAEALLALGQYYLQHARFDKAISQLAKGAERHPADERFLKLLSVASMRRGKPDDGIRYLSRLAAGRPNDPDILANLAFAQFDAGNFDAAEKTFQQARSINPRHPLVHYGLGLIYRYSHRYREARIEFESFLATEKPDSPWYREATAKLEELRRLEK